MLSQFHELIVDKGATDQGNSADLLTFSALAETLCFVPQIVTGIMPVTRGRLSVPSCPQDCPHDIFELIQDCTAQDPEDRPTAKECFARLKVCAAAAPIPRHKSSWGSMTSALKPSSFRIGSVATSTAAV